jgi:hypothetical protein
MNEHINSLLKSARELEQLARDQYFCGRIDICNMPAESALFINRHINTVLINTYGQQSDDTLLHAAVKCSDLATRSNSVGNHVKAYYLNLAAIASVKELNSICFSKIGLKL